MALLANRGLPLGAKGRFCSPCVRGVMLYGREIWLAKEEDVIRLESNDARMVRWMCNVRLEDSTSGEQLRNRLKLASMRKYL